MIYVSSAPVLVGCNVFWIFVETMLLNTKSLNCNKTIGVLFCPKKYQQPAPSNVFLNGVHVQFFDQVKYLGVWINASLKDDDDIQRQAKSLLCSKQTQRHFWSVLSCSKKHFISCLLHANVSLPIVEQIYADQMKRLRAAYNNAYRIMNYIPRNVSVRSHQVGHCVRTFDAVLRNNLYRFFIRCTSSSNFFIRSLQMSDAFYKSSFFLNYSTLLYGGDRMQQLFVGCFGICVSSVLILCNKNMCTLCTHQA